ncbi:hypothetical protein HZH66_011710 [Vespula vulgaris]|uniref:Uncharacterized protein n=1 Tax=Vespula vulgaris TaxID=7454 RepID=A0A834JCW3_VESVU|nr:hypothetical protein HZH66_011710 [Vespula vulgaris]
MVVGSSGVLSTFCIYQDMLIYAEMRIRLSERVRVRFSCETILQEKRTFSNVRSKLERKGKTLRTEDFQAHPSPSVQQLETVEEEEEEEEVEEVEVEVEVEEEEEEKDGGQKTYEYIVTRCLMFKSGLFRRHSLESCHSMEFQRSVFFKLITIVHGRWFTRSANSFLTLCDTSYYLLTINFFHGTRDSL